MASHLTFQEREILYRMNKAAKSQAEIAEVLGRDRSTVWRELNRNTGGRGYRPQQAQRLADERREACRQPTKMSHLELKKYVTGKLKKKWSPEQIAGRLHKDLPRKTDCRVSYQTIYNWLETDAPELREHLRRGTRRSTPETRGQLKDCVSIGGRPKSVDAKRRYGDWEGDTVFALCCVFRGQMPFQFEYLQQRAKQSGAVFCEALPERSRAPGLEVHEFRLVEVCLLECSQPSGEFTIVDRKRDFEIQTKAARVEIERTKEADFAIDGDALGVQQPAIEVGHAHARPQQLSFESLAGVADQSRIDLGWKYENNFHAAPGCRFERHA